MIRHLKMKVWANDILQDFNVRTVFRCIVYIIADPASQDLNCCKITYGIYRE